MTTAAEVRAVLLDAAADIITYKVAMASGQEVPDSIDGRYFDKEEQQHVWAAIVPMMQQAGDLQKTQAESTQEVIKALSAGKITVNDALKLMDILDKQANIEKVNELYNMAEQLKSATPQRAA